MNLDDVFGVPTATSIIAPKSLTLDDVRDAMKLIEDRLKEPRKEPAEHQKFGFVGDITGIPVYTTPYAVSKKRVVRGIASKNKPNRNRPYYRLVTIRTPCAFLYKDLAGRMSAVLHSSIFRHFTEA